MQTPFTRANKPKQVNKIVQSSVGMKSLAMLITPTAGLDQAMAKAIVIKLKCPRKHRRLSTLSRICEGLEGTICQMDGILIQFSRPSIRLLAHIIDGSGLHADPQSLCRGTSTTRLKSSYHNLSTCLNAGIGAVLLLAQENGERHPMY